MSINYLACIPVVIFINIIFPENVKILIFFGWIHTEIHLLLPTKKLLYCLFIYRGKKRPKQEKKNPQKPQKMTLLSTKSNAHGMVINVQPTRGDVRKPSTF